METRYYTKADLMRRYIKRGERRSREGNLAGEPSMRQVSDAGCIGV